MGKIINYIGSGNTARGFAPLYDSIFQDTKEAYVLKGGSNTYKTKVLEKLKKQYAALYDVEVIISSLDTDEIEAIKVPELDLAIFNGNLVHGGNIVISKAKNIEINLDGALDSDKIKANSKYIDDLKNAIYRNLNSSYKGYEKALKIHDVWEAIYINHMDFSKANNLAESLVNKLITSKKDSDGKTFHRYLGGATPKGRVDFVPNLIDGLKNYYIKGRAGTGKSTVLKKIAKKAEDNGFTVEVYHCGFDPSSLDMVIVRELGFAIFDSTAPHEYFPSLDTDEVVDFYKELFDEDVDSIYADEIEQVESEYIIAKKEASNYLKKAGENKDKLDSIYDEAFDEEKADKIVADKLAIN